MGKAQGRRREAHLGVRGGKNGLSDRTVDSGRPHARTRNGRQGLAGRTRVLVQGEGSERRGRVRSAGERWKRRRQEPIR